MPRNVGRRNRYITITQRDAGTDAAGDQLTTWSTLRSEWAEFLAPTGRAQADRFAADRQVAPVAYSVRIAFCADVTAAMRVTCDGITYDIAQVVPDVARREYTDLVCVAGVV